MIDRFYHKIKKHILLAVGYTERPDLEFIIRACRLKPLEILKNPSDQEVRLHRHWVDEYFNSLLIIKNKRIRIILNDLSILDCPQTSTDLYVGLPLDKVALMSKLAFLFCGQEKENHNPHYIISFLGLDNYLRTFIYADKEWEQYSSLYLGMPILKFIAKNKDIKYFLEYKQKEKIIYPCNKQAAWLTFWPPHEDFLVLLEKENEEFFNFIFKKETK
jgi:hypothetical protein